MSNASGSEMIIERVIDAPRELIFRAFTEPEHVKHWWGPNGFTNTIHEMDVRPGGIWRFIMHGPDGTDYPNKIVYVEVTPPERLVYEHSGDRPDGPVSFRSTITREATGGKTKVTLRADLGSVEEFQRAKEFGAVEGGQQTLARLDAYVKAMAA